MFQNNSNRQKQVIFLMISIGEGWRYLSVEKPISIINKNNVKIPW